MVSRNIPFRTGSLKYCSDVNSSDGINGTVDSGKGAGSPRPAVPKRSLTPSYLNSCNPMSAEGKA